MSSSENDRGSVLAPLITFGVQILTIRLNGNMVLSVVIKDNFLIVIA